MKSSVTDFPVDRPGPAARLRILQLPQPAYQAHACDEVAQAGYRQAVLLGICGLRCVQSVEASVFAGDVAIVGQSIFPIHGVVDFRVGKSTQRNDFARNRT